MAAIMPATEPTLFQSAGEATTYGKATRQIVEASIMGKARHNQLIRFTLGFREEEQGSRRKRQG